MRALLEKSGLTPHDQLVLLKRIAKEARTLRSHYFVLATTLISQGERSHDQEAIVLGYALLAEGRYVAGQTVEAAQAMTQIIRQAEQKGMINVLPQLYMNMALSSLDYFSDYPSALRYAHQAASVAQSTGNTTYYAFALNVVGDAHYRSGNFTKAEEYCRASLSLRIAMLQRTVDGRNDVLYSACGWSQHNIAMILCAVKQCDSAWQYAHAALTSFQQAHDTVGIGMAYRVMALIWQNRVQSKEDIVRGGGKNTFLDSALLYAGRIQNDKIFAVRIHRDIADILFAMKLFTYADTIAQKGIALLPSVFAKHYEAELYRIRAQALHELHRYTESLSCYKEYRRCMEYIAKESVLVSIDATEKDIKDREVRQQLEQEVTSRKIAQTEIRYMFGAVILCLLMGGSTFFVWYRTKKRLETQKEEDTLREHYRKESLQTLYLGQEIERRLIAKDIHDGLGATLSLAKLQLSSVSTALMSRENEIIHNVLRVIDHAVEDIRLLARRLSSQLLSEYGLEIALQDYVQSINEAIRTTSQYQSNTSIHPATKLPMTIVLNIHHCAGLRFSEQIEISLFRVIQEIITNTIKHARAEHLYIDLVYRDATLILTTQDTGIGFNQHHDGNKSIGLKGMQKRIQSVEGTFELDSILGKGTCIVVQIPAKIVSSFP